jgi:hypothetical protein
MGRRLRTTGPEGDTHPPSQPGPDGCVVETHVSAAVDGRYGDRRRARNNGVRSGIYSSSGLAGDDLYPTPVSASGKMMPQLTRELGGLRRSNSCDEISERRLESAINVNPCATCFEDSICGGDLLSAFVPADGVKSQE